MCSIFLCNSSSFPTRVNVCLSIFLSICLCNGFHFFFFFVSMPFFIVQFSVPYSTFISFLPFFSLFLLCNFSWFLFFPQDRFVYSFTYRLPDLSFPLLSVISSSCYLTTCFFSLSSFIHFFSSPFLLAPTPAHPQLWNGGSKNGDKEGGKAPDVTQIHPSCEGAQGLESVAHAQGYSPKTNKVCVPVRFWWFHIFSRDRFKGGPALATRRNNSLKSSPIFVFS